MGGESIRGKLQRIAATGAVTDDDKAALLRLSDKFEEYVGSQERSLEEQRAFLRSMIESRGRDTKYLLDNPTRLIRHIADLLGFLHTAHEGEWVKRDIAQGVKRWVSWRKFVFWREKARKLAEENRALRAAIAALTQK